MVGEWVTFDSFLGIKVTVKLSTLSLKDHAQRSFRLFFSFTPKPLVGGTIYQNNRARSYCFARQILILAERQPPNNYFSRLMRWE